MPKKLFPTTVRIVKKGKNYIPIADFYLEYGFISRSEHDQLVQGQMSIEKNYGFSPKLLNLNASRQHTPLLPGEKTLLYKGRAEDIALYYLFGIPMPDPKDKKP